MILVHGTLTNTNTSPVSNPTTTTPPSKRSPVTHPAPALFLRYRVSERSIRRRAGSHGLPQPRAAEAGCRDGGGRRGAAIVWHGGGVGRCRGAANAEEGPGGAEGARVHGQGTHQPHAALRRREEELYLPRGHPVRLNIIIPSFAASELPIESSHRPLRSSNGSLVRSPELYASIRGLSRCLRDSGSAICLRQGVQGKGRHRSLTPVGAHLFD
jgi:hypothetical protein